METLNCDCMESEESKYECLQTLIEKYKGKKGALIPVLHHALHLYGYLSKDVLYAISKGLKVPISEVMGLVTFYSFFSTEPRGENHITVCTGTACYVKGSESVFDKFKELLHLEDGGATEDMLFSLQSARCFGACGLAPAVDVSGKVYRQMTPSKVTDFVKEKRGV